MLARFLHGLRESSRDAHSPAREPEGPPKTTRATSPKGAPTVSRRTFLAGGAAAASLGLAGCAGRAPGTTADIDVAARTDGSQLLWDYPARAVEDDEDSDGIGYAAIRFGVVDTVGPNTSVDPALTFRLNSTVGGIAAGSSYKGYQADWFRFRLGVPRSYDGLAGLRASVRPRRWPEIQTTYGYHNARRDLVVHAPHVHSDGTIVVEGRFRPPGTTVPRQVHCGFEVHASRSGPLGRRVLATGQELFDLSTVDLPDGITVE